MTHPTRRSVLFGLAALPLASRGLFAAAAQPSLMFAGTYTDQGSKGIYVYEWRPGRGELVARGVAVETPNPSFLALSPSRRALYAVNEVNTFQGERSGSVSAFGVDRISGRLTPKNVVSSGGAGPCNITVDHTGGVVCVADYDGGSCSSYKVGADGNLSAAVSHFHFTGRGPDAKRQEAAHTHCTTISPDNGFLLVNDLGLDRIMVYRLQADTGRLTPNTPPYYSALPGSGPRNLTFHPNGRWAYSLNEMGNSLDVLAWNSAHGTLTRLQNISTLATGFHGEDTAATVAASSDGRFVYASDRGADCIAVFTVDTATGKLSPLQQVSSGGKAPRHFAIDPSGKWLLTANQDTSNIVVLARDAQTGRLTPTGREYSLSRPVCLMFA